MNRVIDSTTPTRNAVRLISTNGLNHDEWLHVRKQGIGSSDAAAAVGLNPYQSQLELWLIKTGRDQHLAKVDPNDESSPMYWGTLLEPIVAVHYTKRTGKRVRRINAVLQHPDADKSWMLANIDYAVNNDAEVQILECKTAGEFGVKLWRDGVPEYIQCQVQHQLAVTGKKAVDVCVLVCGQEIRIYRIERDDELIARLITLERQFWHYIETDTQPPADGSDSAESALRCLYPQDVGRTIDLRGDKEMLAIFNRMLQVRADLEAHQQEDEILKQHIQQCMGDASKALFDTGTVTWKRSKGSSTLDVKRLLSEKPELLNKYPLNRLGSRRFVVHATNSIPNTTVASNTTIPTLQATVTPQLRSAS